MLFYHEKLSNGRDNGFWEVDEDDLIYAEFGDEIRLYNQFGGFHYHILTVKMNLSLYRTGMIYLGKMF